MGSLNTWCACNTLCADLIHTGECVLRFFWGTAGLFMGIYAIVQDLNIPLIVQPQLFSALCFLSWTQVGYCC